VDANAADVADVAQPDVRPGLARVRGFVDAVADGDVRAVAVGAGPDVDGVGSDSETSIAPMEPAPICPSVTLSQLWPASTVFQTPPPVEPM
jgi:hypothetical protein